MHRPGTNGPQWENFLELKRLTRALSDEVRLNIVHVLAAFGEMKVTDLALALVVSQPLVSWHLSILKRAELVVTRRKGREVYCSFNAHRYDRCIALLESLVAGSGETSPPAQASRDPSRVGP